MLITTPGIVLSYINYGDTSLIVRIFTEKLGLKAYIVNGVRAKKARVTLAHFQPMTLLDLVVYDKEGRDLHRCKEISLHYPYRLLPFDPVASGLLMFSAELLGRILVEADPHAALFQRARQQLIGMDQGLVPTTVFPLRMLLDCCQEIGFLPENLEELLAELGEDRYAFGLNSAAHEAFNGLLAYPEDVDPVQFPLLSSSLRRLFFDLLIQYIDRHLEDSRPWKSPAILRHIWA
ncbi:MAG: DNA repair protein RecO [Nitritalea sp.]